MSRLCMLFIVFVVFQISGNVHAADHLQDVDYQFDSVKLKKAQDSFHFLRSFVDYFYLLIDKNRSNLEVMSSIEQISGFCVGDAHAENFGFLIQKNKTTLFTMNDVDDFGPCPVILDFVRFVVGTRLYNSSISIDPFWKNYLSGLNRQQVSLPPALLKLQNKSLQNGLGPDDKAVSGRRILRDNHMEEISDSLKNEIDKAVDHVIGQSFSSAPLLIDAVETSKSGGGSGGLVRYELLYDLGNSLLHLELKEQIKPSIYPVATEAIPATCNRLALAFNIEQGESRSDLYSCVQLFGHDFLIRPKYSGNVGVNLNKLSGNEITDVMNYEAYALGMIHARSLNAKVIQKLIRFDYSKIKNDSLLLSNKIDQKYKDLTGAP